MFGHQPPYLSFISEALWSLGGASREEKGEAEEPETATQEQARFEWAWVWMEEGGSPALAESESQRLLAQVFSFGPLYLLFCLAPYLSVLTQDYIWATWSFCLFFQGLCQLQQASFLWWEVECLETNGLQSGASGGRIGGWGPIWHPSRGHAPTRSFHICWPTSAQEVQVSASGMVLHLTAQEAKAPSPVPNFKGWHTCLNDTPTGQHRGHPPHLSLPGQGVPWGTLILPCHYLFSCVPCPSGHEAVVSFAFLHSSILMPSDGIASGQIALGPQTQLKECHTSV